MAGVLLWGQAASGQQTSYRWWNPAKANFPVLEGQGWPGRTALPYDRFPARAEKSVRPVVWGLSRNSAGLMLRFRTKAEDIRVRYTVTQRLNMPHMPSTGVSGVDLYGIDKDGRWQWSSGSYAFGDTIEYHFQHLPGDYQREYRLYLPLYNQVSWLEIGVPDSIALQPLPARADKPIVVYGTSIAQGGCASRPGMAWPALLGRRLDRPVINLAFSGNGRLEPAVSALLGELDAKLFVLDCFPNLTGFPRDTIIARLRATVFALQKARPGVPILIAEDADASIGALDRRRDSLFQHVNAAARQAFTDLVAGATKDVYFLSSDSIALDMESTVDGVHPNDVGMEKYARAYEKIIREILQEPKGSLSTTQPCIQYRDGYYDWDARHQALLKMNKAHPPTMVFLGNSITHYWGGEPAAPLHRGADSWKKYLDPLGMRNFGFGWDRVENVLWRVYHDELDGYRARKVVLMIGTNNIGLDSDRDIITGLDMLLRAIRNRQPTADILMLGIYPRRGQEARVRALNGQMALLAGKARVSFADPGRKLLGADGRIQEQLFVDGLHPNAEGYRLLGASLERLLVGYR